MALPAFLIPMLIGGAALGANVAKNKDEDLLKGALKGALLGGLGAGGLSAAGVGAGAGAGAAGAGITKAAATGGASAAANPITGVLAQQTGSGGAAAALKADVAAKAAASKAAAAKASTAAIVPPTNAASTVGADSLFSAADLGLNVNPATGSSLTTPTNTFSAFQAQNTANKAALDSAVGSITNPITEKIALSPGAKLLATAKAKPMETMMFVSALGGGGQQQAPAPSMVPLTQPGGFGDVPTIEQSIGMDSGPRFVSKGLFDESRRSMEEEEMALMYEKLSEAGLV